GQFRAHGGFVGIRLFRVQLRLLCGSAGLVRVGLSRREGGRRCSLAVCHIRIRFRGCSLCVHRVVPGFCRVGLSLRLVRFSNRRIGLRLLPLPNRVFGLALGLHLRIGCILAFVCQADLVHLLNSDGTRIFGR